MIQNIEDRLEYLRVNNDPLAVILYEILQHLKLNGTVIDDTLVDD